MWEPTRLQKKRRSLLPTNCKSTHYLHADNHHMTSSSPTSECKNMCDCRKHVQETTVPCPPTVHSKLEFSSKLSPKTTLVQPKCPCKCSKSGFPWFSSKFYLHTKIWPSNPLGFSSKCPARGADCSPRKALATAAFPRLQGVRSDGCCWRPVAALNWPSRWTVATNLRVGIARAALGVGYGRVRNQMFSHYDGILRHYR